MHAQHFFAPAHIRTSYDHAAVETSRPQQCWVKHVRAVGGGNQNDAIVRLKTVHLDQQLVQCLLTLIVSATQTCSAVTAYGVNFINKDDAGGVLLALLKQIADTARAHTHFHEVRAGNREKRNIGFSGDSARQQRFTCARRSNQQHALGNAPAELLELLRLAQKLDNLLQLFFGLIHAGHIFKGDLFLLHRKQPRAALPKRQRLVAASLHLPQHKEPQQANNDDRRKVDNDRQPRASVLVLYGHRHFVL